MNATKKSINSKVKYIKDLAKIYNVSDIVNFLFSDKKYAGFLSWSGSSSSRQHHYGTGGLFQHTWEVVNLCEINAKFSNELGQFIDKKVLFLAALFHDIGKLWDYELVDDIDITSGWDATLHKRLIHHISRSAIEWNLICVKFNVDTTLIDVVTHCILSHHGSREWGSPVSPKMREAWILHLCDGLSARTNDCDKFDRF